MVSAGSTGATMTAALFALRRTQGVRRPALALQLAVPGRQGPPTILLDVGANSEARCRRSRPVRLPRQRLLAGGARGRAPAGGAAFDRRGGEQGHVPAGRGTRGPRRRARAGVRRQRRGARPDDRHGRRDRHRRVHRQRRPEDARGHGAIDLGRAQRCRPLEPGLARSAGCSCARRWVACGARWTRTPPAGRSCSGLRGVAVVAHGSSGPEGIANAVRLAARAVEQDAVERTAALLASSGATRSRAAA